MTHQIWKLCIVRSRLLHCISDYYVRFPPYLQINHLTVMKICTQKRSITFKNEYICIASQPFNFRSTMAFKIILSFNL